MKSVDNDDNDLSMPDGYEKYLEVCYKAFKALKTFSKSAKTCRADGGTLAMPRDAGIHDFLFSLMKPLLPLPLFDFWIGLHDERQEGKWEWIDGTALGTGYNRWKNGQPDNYGGNQDCAFYSYWGSGRSPSSAFWYDEPCNRSNRFICQVLPSAAPGK
ncbi:C-type lectin domain family 3 member A-like [Branchiostoma floridae x Branchiostoma belcheri]